MARKLRVEYPGAIYHVLNREELKRRGWSSDQLTGRRKRDREKVRIARRLRSETTTTLDWIAQRQNMGAAGYAAQCL